MPGLGLAIRAIDAKVSPNGLPFHTTEELLMFMRNRSGLFAAVLCLIAIHNGPAIGQDSPQSARENWAYFDSSLLRPEFHGATSFDFSIETGSAKQRRVEVEMMYPKTPGDELRIGESKRFVARAVQVGENRYRIEGLPDSLVGAGESLIFSFPATNAMRAVGPMVLQSNDGREIRAFRMYRYRGGHASINSPD
jgi:hypothetical protein